MEPRVEIVVVVEVVIAVVSVTSTGIARILEEGKSVCRAWMAGWEVWRVEGSWGTGHGGFGAGGEGHEGDCAGG
jgi:hypothetical protein